MHGFTCNDLIQQYAHPFFVREGVSFARVFMEAAEEM
jgi:hypothetical protein